MAQQIATPVLLEESPPACRHHWVIQAATAPVSLGVCQICSEVKEFKNYVEASTWGDEKPGSRSSLHLAKPAAAPFDDDEDDE